MTKKEVTVSDILNGYKNPIAELVQVACCYESEITIQSNHRKINAKSIMGVMAFQPDKGMVVEVATEGKDEKAALAAMEGFLLCKKEGTVSYA